MILFLKRKSFFLHCRLFMLSPTGFVHGLCCRKRSLELRWWRLHNAWHRWPMTSFPGHMSGVLVFGLIAISVCEWCFHVYAVCFQQRLEVISRTYIFSM